jgi:serine/threonine protein phosphatase PrpC
MADPLSSTSEGNPPPEPEASDTPVVQIQKEVQKIHSEGSSIAPKELNSLNLTPALSSAAYEQTLCGVTERDTMKEAAPKICTEDSETQQQITPPPSPPPLKPAVWEVKEPTEKWWPDTLANDSGIGSDYKHELTFFSKYGNDWMFAAATKRGRMHAHHGTYREDALWGSLGNNFSFTCVCDGAGSSKLSRIGSQYTAKKLSELVQKELAAHQRDILQCSKESLPNNLRSILHYCLDSVQRGLLDIAAQGGIPPKEFRCTVLTTLHYRHPSGGILLCGNVGDGFIAVKCKDQAAIRVGTSDSGAFSGEVACFMPDPEVANYYKKSLEENVPIPDDNLEAYILCTDGVEDPFFPIHRTVDDIYIQLLDGYTASIKEVSYPLGAEPSSVFRAKEPGEELLKWLSFEKRGENDDRTIAVIYHNVLGQNSVIKDLSEQEPTLEETSTSIHQESAKLISTPRDTAKLQLLLAMIVGALIVACAFILGLILGQRIGAHSEISAFTR